jgi:hypothetical protein
VKQFPALLGELGEALALASGLGFGLPSHPGHSLAEFLPHRLGLLARQLHLAISTLHRRLDQVDRDVGLLAPGAPASALRRKRNLLAGVLWRGIAAAFGALPNLGGHDERLKQVFVTLRQLISLAYSAEALMMKPLSDRHRWSRLSCAGVPSSNRRRTCVYTCHLAVNERMLEMMLCGGRTAATGT